MGVNGDTVASRDALESIERRFPAIDGFDGMDDGQRITALQQVLSDLQHDLDVIGK